MGASSCGGEAVITLQRQLVLVVLLVSGACATNPAEPDSTNSLPPWLRTLIRQSEEQPAANPLGFIAGYDYKGQTVYFVPQRCCDIMSILYRADGSVACHPDGGFTGTGDGSVLISLLNGGTNESSGATRVANARRC
jgi:hypothetical protein